MKTYKAKFERINFGYKPSLNQSADVLFQTDIPFDNEHITEFEEACWAAMWKQNPHWENPEGPLPDRAGWSSVLGVGSIEEVELSDNPINDAINTMMGGEGNKKDKD